jgi:hypothetical protein
MWTSRPAQAERARAARSGCARPPCRPGRRSSRGRGSSTTNSSPPSRAMVSPSRTQRRRRSDDLHQQLVPEVVAHRVVDGLEVVQVEQQHADRSRRCAARLRQRHPQAVVEERAVGQLREAVVVGLMPDALLHAACARRRRASPRTPRRWLPRSTSAERDDLQVEGACRRCASRRTSRGVPRRRRAGEKSRVSAPASHVRRRRPRPARRTCAARRRSQRSTAPRSSVHEHDALGSCAPRSCAVELGVRASASSDVRQPLRASRCTMPRSTVRPSSRSPTDIAERVRRASARCVASSTRRNTATGRPPTSV